MLQVLAAIYLPAPNPQNWDFSLDQPPVPLPSFLKKYDFTQIPNIPRNEPQNNAGPAACNPAIDQTLAGTCSFSCNGCIRTTELYLCPSTAHWGISYDDGPTDATVAILDYLAAKNLRVTFCVVGSRVKQRPDLLLRIYQEGHQICAHTWSHRALTTQTVETIIAELEWTLLAIEQVIGHRPLYFRAPFDDRVRAITRAMGLTALVWNFDSKDFQLTFNTNALPPNDIENRVDTLLQQANRTTGIVSLQHDISTNTTVHAIPVLDRILNAKLTPMSVTECNNIAAPYKNSQLVLPPSMQNVQPIPSNAVTGPSTVVIDVPAATYTARSSAYRNLPWFMFF
ncbi:family 4 carbohydrate esterase [Gorgonomyces haynaldii]|nr:family 4 carbohydrate esterase [Gorgonomyces haynaldii]